MSNKPQIISYSEEHDCLTTAKWSQEHKSYIHVKPINKQVVSAQEVLNSFRAMAKSTKDAVKAQQETQQEFESKTYETRDSFFNRANLSNSEHGIKVDVDSIDLSDTANAMVDKLLAMIPEEDRKLAEVRILDIIDSTAKGTIDTVNKMMNETSHSIKTKIDKAS